MDTCRTAYPFSFYGSQAAQNGVLFPVVFGKKSIKGTARAETAQAMP